MIETAFSDSKNSIEAVIRVLLMAVYSDGRKRHAEMGELLRCLPALQNFTSSQFSESGNDLVGIVKSQESEVISIMRSSDTASVDHAIRSINEPTLAQLVIKEMYSIAYSDKQYDYYENELLSRAAEIWNINVSEDLEPEGNMFPQ